jgi:hypothetical protein
MGTKTTKTTKPEEFFKMHFVTVVFFVLVVIRPKAA